MNTCLGTIKKTENFFFGIQAFVSDYLGFFVCIFYEAKVDFLVRLEEPKNLSKKLFKPVVQNKLRNRINPKLEQQIGPILLLIFFSLIVL